MKNETILNVSTHKKLLNIINEIELNIIGLQDPYGLNLSEYKSYLKLLSESTKFLYENIECDEVQNDKIKEISEQLEQMVVFTIMN